MAIKNKSSEYLFAIKTVDFLICMQMMVCKYFFHFVYRQKRTDREIHQIKNGEDENAKTSQLSHTSVGTSETQRNSSKTKGGKYKIVIGLT